MLTRGCPAPDFGPVARVAVERHVSVERRGPPPGQGAPGGGMARGTAFSVPSDGVAWLTLTETPFSRSPRMATTPTRMKREQRPRPLQARPSLKRQRQPRNAAPTHSRVSPWPRNARLPRFPTLPASPHRFRTPSPGTSRVVDMSKRMSTDETAGGSLVDMLGDDDDDFHG